MVVVELTQYHYKEGALRNPVLFQTHLVSKSLGCYGGELRVSVVAGVHPTSVVIMPTFTLLLRLSVYYLWACSTGCWFPYQHNKPVNCSLHCARCYLLVVTFPKNDVCRFCPESYI